MITQYSSTLSTVVLECSLLPLPTQKPSLWFRKWPRGVPTCTHYVVSENWILASQCAQALPLGAVNGVGPVLFLVVLLIQHKRTGHDLLLLLFDTCVLLRVDKDVSIRGTLFSLPLGSFVFGAQLPLPFSQQSNFRDLILLRLRKCSHESVQFRSCSPHSGQHIG